MTVYRIEKPPYSRYMTVAQTLQYEGQRYLYRAAWYLLLGKLDYAVGCLNKYQRKLRKAEEMQWLFR